VGRLKEEAVCQALIAAEGPEQIRAVIIGDSRGEIL
jgi:hypothetical protein